jgi:hypothetical protein
VGKTLRYRRSVALATLSALALWPVHFAAVAAGASADSGGQTFRSSWEEYQAHRARAHGGEKHTVLDLPDWTGIWQRDSNGLLASFDDSAGVNPMLGRVYGRSTASLTPKYRAAYETKVADIRVGKEWDRLSNCLPAGFPRMLAEPFLREFIVTPAETWMSHEQINETRRVYTDGRGHVPDDEAVPLWLGDSIGFWDGDTLVVHTNHLKAGEYQRGQPDFSFQISTVERIRKVDAQTIEDRISVYDPVSLMRPWQVVFHYKKVEQPGLRINYDACEENNNVYLAPDGTTRYILPGDPKYRDPTTFGIPAVAVGTDK